MTQIASLTRRGYKEDGKLWDEVTITKHGLVVGVIPVHISKTAPTHDETLENAGFDAYTWDFELETGPTIPLDKLFFNGHNAPIHKVEELSAFSPTSELGAARYQYEYDDTKHLDALLVNKGSDVLVVHLHGATVREHTKLPRFERLATLSNEDVSALYFSDPTLLTGEKIQLTWYTGWPGEDVQAQIAEWTRITARKLGVRRVIVAGSSGGGFASLQISALLPGSLAATFNPQTSIHKYYVGGDPNVRGVQRAYIRNVHPEIADGPIEKMDLTPDWTLDLGVETSVVRRYSAPVDNHVLFVQNVNDWHYQQHYEPFLEACAKAGNSEQVRLLTYDGPKQHVAPGTKEFIMGMKEALEWVRELPPVTWH